MPTYEYKRKDGTTFEVFQSMSDNPLTECPTTGQPVKRIISGGSGIVYKGDGFYTTDYKMKEQKNGKSEPSKTESTEAKSSDKKDKAGD